jgi:putative NIF3 family GTP cyclohydrolase 1 type 2
MKTKEIFNLAIKKGIQADFRSKKGVENLLKRKEKNYDRLPEHQKKNFDKESLQNPYLDSRILNISKDKAIKKVLVGIDIAPAEILLAKELGNVDLIISHHPLGKALANLHEVMELQADVLNQYGVPINVAEGLMSERISEVARGLNSANHERTVDAARLLGINLMCLHTAADNLAAKFLKDKIEKNKDIVMVEDLINVLESIPEYQKAISLGSGPKVFVGKKQNRCGKIALTEITGGTQGSPKLYEKMAIAGIGTVVAMHISEEHKKEAEAANLNVVIAGHMSSDSLGVNLILDELEKRGIEIVPCSGLIRVSRTKKRKHK